MRKTGVPRSIRLKAIYLAMVVFLCTSVTALGERLPVRPLSTSDGLASGAINDVLCDSRGFVWFATRDGLSRYDGVRITNYRLGITTTQSIFQIIERKNGDYLIVKQGPGIYRFNASTSVTEEPGFEMQTLNAVKIFEADAGRVFEDAHGELWLSADAKLFHLTESPQGLVRDSPIDLKSPDGKSLEVVYAKEDKFGTFWIATDRGVVRADPRTGRLLEFLETPLPDAMRTYVQYIFRDAHDRIWIKALDAAFVLIPSEPDESRDLQRDHLKENIVGRLPDRPGEIVRWDADDGFPEFNMSALYESGDGRIWLVGERGLVVFNGSEFRIFNETNGLGDFLTDISEDSNGNLWLGSFTGAYRISMNGFSSYGTSDGLARSDISSIFENRPGEIFTIEGDWHTSRFNGKKFISLRPSQDLMTGSPLWTSNGALRDSRGSWWYLLENSALRFDDIDSFNDLAKARPSAVYKTGDQFNNGAFYRIFEDSAGDIWIANRSTDTSKSALNVWRGGRGQSYKVGEAENFPSGKPPSAFCEDGEGRLWVGFYYGAVGRFENGRFHLFTREEGAPGGFIGQIYRDNRNRIWIASSEFGVHVVDDPNATPVVFRKIAGISNNARALTEDVFGRIYVGTVRGIDRITPETGRLEHFSSVDGLADDFVTCAFRSQTGELWFGTRRGVSKLVPKPDIPETEPPILIAGLRVSGVKLPNSELGSSEVTGIGLSSSQNNILIDFFSVGRGAHGGVDYQFMLEGADENWSKPTKERSVNFSNLGAGTYRFLVRAVNSQGLASSKPATVEFHISPPFWATWWFMSLIVFIAIAVIYIVLDQRFKRVLELEKVRTRIATDLHDDIGASLSRISMLSEIVKSQSAADDTVSQKRLSQIAGDSRDLVDSMSDIVWAINPRRDSIESVIDRVCSFASDTLCAKEVAWTVNSPPEIRSLHLTAEEKRNLYLIFKEAVNNAARHSHCMAASFTVKLERGELVMQITDDGIGLNSDSVDSRSMGGRGLINMKSRAAEIGARIDFIADKPQGTTIVVSLPIGLYRRGGRK